VGDQWSGPNIGHLYQVLDRRARDGLIESERQPQAVKPDRRAELDRWLSEPNVRTRGYRDDFFLKVVAAAQAGDPETLAAVLRLPAAPEATPDTRSSSA
jgi:DNA-binding PadR family transcriptional regulator